ncbi:MAG: DUF58 domain-containing protein, partial [Soonwooa sp.]
MKALYLNNRLFFALMLAGIIYVLAFFFPILIWLAHIVVILILILAFVDYLILFKVKDAIKAHRS